MWDPTRWGPEQHDLEFSFLTPYSGFLMTICSPCSPVGFADDGALCFKGICPHTLVEIAQPFINMAVEWGAQNGLSFSVDKKSVVFFITKYNFYSNELNGVKKLTINGVDITPSESMTYLGGCAGSQT